MHNRIRAGLIALMVAAPLSIGGSAVGGVVTAEPAEAATIIRGDCYRFYAYTAGNQYTLNRRCWVDYSSWEEVVLRKRDCYCYVEPVLYF